MFWKPEAAKPRNGAAAFAPVDGEVVDGIQYQCAVGLCLRRGGGVANQAQDSSWVVLKIIPCTRLMHLVMRPMKWGAAPFGPAGALLW